MKKVLRLTTKSAYGFDLTAVFNLKFFLKRNVGASIKKNVNVGNGQ